MKTLLAITVSAIISAVSFAFVMTRYIRYSTTVSALTIVLAMGVMTSATFADSKDQSPGTSESARKKFCLDLKHTYIAVMAEYDEDRRRRGQAKRTADNIRLLAEGNNCAWAA